MMDLWVSKDECCEGVENAREDMRELAVAAASQFMWARTGRQFGTGVETVRPCRSRRGADRIFDLPLYPVWGVSSSGSYGWGSPCGCSRPDGCSCSGTSWVKLPRDYIREILAVTIDGETIPTSEYRLRGRNRLYRRGASWPCCQNLSLDDTEAGTWSIQYRYGLEVPEIAKVGARRFACETLKALAGDQSCRFPRNVQIAARQGLTLQMAQFLGESRQTGLYEVDAAIEALNPSGLERRATVWSPELSGKAVRERPVSS